MKNLLKNKLLWLLAIALLAHGMILMMDGLYWDDYLIHGYLGSGNYSDILSMYSEHGDVFAAGAYFHLFINLLFNKNLLFGWHLFAFFSIFLSGLLFYKLLRKVDSLSEKDAFYAASLFVSYPAYKIAFIGITYPYLFCLFLFLLAAYLSSFGVADRSLRSFLVRAACLLLFFLSFNTNSLLLFYFGFLAYWLLIAQPGRFSIEGIKQFLLTRLDYLMLPFIYYLVKIWVFPTHGYFQTYNSLFMISLKGMAVTAVLLTFYALKPLLTILPFSLYVNALLWAIFIIILLIFIYKSRGDERVSVSKNTLGFGLFLAALGIFPYALLGLRPSEAYGSRHLFLLVLPISIILVALVNATKAILPKIGKIKKYIYIYLLLVFIGMNLVNYVNWQFKWIKDRSLLQQLKEHKELKKYATFYITNNTYRPGELEMYRLRSYEWATMFKLAWGEERWIGFSTNQNIPKVDKAYAQYFTHRYNLSHYDPSGPKAAMTISYRQKNIDPGQLDRTRYVEEYFYDKFCRRDKLRGFLENIVYIKVTPAKLVKR